MIRLIQKLVWWVMAKVVSATWNPVRDAPQEYRDLITLAVSKGNQRLARQRR